MEETVVIQMADYPSGNSFGIWYHYAISYSNPIDVFDVYLDGTLLTGLTRNTSPISTPDVNTGTLVLAKGDYSDPDGDDANMKLDEIVFWERVMIL